jgi:hypothetical protein
MVSIRSTAAALLFAAVAPAAFASAPAGAPTIATTLSGVVRDDVGAVLEGVEVLILAPEGGGGGALLRAMSDAGGRFVVGSIAPGVYRIAAIKSGYIAALGRVNTVLRSSVDLVLRPVPKGGQPGADKVLDDLSWTLRVPPRSILRELDARAVLRSADTGGARAFAARVQDALRGEVDHVVALGSWRPGPSGPSSNLEGNETHMRLAGVLGERGAIQVRGRRGSLDSSSPPAVGAVSRGASDLDVDMSYDTSADESVAMRAFYSAGDLAVGNRPGVPGTGSRQSQRSWGYDATWRKQVDASSHVALQVGFHDANLDPGQVGAAGWDVAPADGFNRAIGAEGSYENFVGDGHLVRLGVRAQRLSLSLPGARSGRANEAFALNGSPGWSVLIDTADQWSVTGPVAVTYGLALRQGFDGPAMTTLAPRVGGSVTAGRLEARAEMSYFATTGDSPGSADAALSARRSPYGYEVELKARLDSTVTLRGTASYVPSRADVWGGRGVAQDLETLYVTDGFASDRFVAVDLERVASSATVFFRVARGHAEGALAPALDDVPVVLLADRALDYDAARVGVKAPRAGAMVSLEYRAIREHAAMAGVPETDPLRTVALDFAQELVRFAGGRASCRFLLTARGALGSGSMASGADTVDARRFVAENRRIGAGVSLAF